MPERQVRVTHSFFDRLDEVLPAGRGAVDVIWLLIDT